MSRNRCSISPIPCILILLIFLLSLPSLFAQDKNGRKETVHKSQPTYRSAMDVVVVNATVTDKAGNPVTDLTADDFRVYDDGKLQTIQTFALEEYGVADEGEENKGEPSRTLSTPDEEAPEPEKPTSRLISFVIDDQTMYTPTEFRHLINFIKDYVNKEMRPIDQIAVLSASGDVQLPFLSDKQQLLDGLNAGFEKLHFLPAIRSDCPMLTDYQARQFSKSSGAWDMLLPEKVKEAKICLSLKYGYEVREEQAKAYLYQSAVYQNLTMEGRTRNLLYLLRQHVRALRHFEGSKMVILLTDGFIAERESPEAHLVQEITDMALRAGIVFNIWSTQAIPMPFRVDLSSDQMKARQASGIHLHLRHDDEDIRAQEEPLAQIASGTGGLFSRNNNSFYRGLGEVVRRRFHQYILSYGIPSRKADGMYHKIKLVLTRPGLKLSYRKEYQSPKEELTFESTRKEDIIDALSGPGNMNEIPVTISYNYFQYDESTYALSLITKVKTKGMQFLQEDGRRRNTVSLILAAYDENDRYISGVDKSIDFKLLEENYIGVQKDGLTSRVELKLPVGRYKIRAVVRESNQGKMGSITKSVEIP